jgi:hypothetical protein
VKKREILDAKAKARRQKMVAIGGAVVLLLVLAIQGPKTLKMLKPPKQEAAPPAATVSVETDADGSASVTVEANGSSVTISPSSAQLADSYPTVAAGDGQLVSFERFASKDPFAQQVTIPTESVDASGGPVDLGTLPAAGGAAAGEGPTGSGEENGFTTGTDPGGTTTAAPPASATTISVNGEPEAVAAGADFPALDPIFSLVTLGKNGKSVEIGIAGGALATGKDTVKLELGEPVTLMNTADGTRYTLVLLTVQGF